jgi:methyl-accepting chemotaxis protein
MTRLPDRTDMPVKPKDFSQWSLRARLIAFAVGSAASTALIGGYAIVSGAKLSDSIRRIYQQRTLPLAKLDVVGRTLERQRANVLSTIAAPTDESIQALRKSVAADSASLGKLMSEYRQGAPHTDELALAETSAKLLDTLQKDGLAKVIDFLQKGQNIEADAASQSAYVPQAQAVSRVLDDLIKLQIDLAEREYLVSTQTVRTQTVATLIITALALLTGFALAALIARALHRTLGAHEGELKRVALGVTEGNLTGKIAVRTSHNASVAESLNSMVTRFSALVAEVASSARWVAQSSRRLAGASNDLSERTNSQAAAIEQTASSMQQIYSAAQQNGENALQARELAAGGMKIAASGREAMVEVAATMSGITDYSRRIAEIVGVIDGIAFQTNLLALNASVEAARAGELGRGFAVVATEVRDLAQRSASAAKEIRSLIESSATRVNMGNQLVGKAGKTMEDIVASTQRVSALISEIAGVSAEQIDGIKQVNTAIVELENVTQHNAALAGRAAEEAQNMSGQASVLVTATSRFDIDTLEQRRNPNTRHSVTPASAPCEIGVDGRTMKNDP